ncbi:MAG: hypothetical protein GY861_17235 [bacterium]|nr:hypothetical protein [bacterium]
MTKKQVEKRYVLIAEKDVIITGTTPKNALSNGLKKGKLQLLLVSCPKCGSHDWTYEHYGDELECLDCKHKWRRPR